MTPSLVAIVLGLTLGVRHAFEPDHLAAVSVLNAETPSWRRGFALGALWGVGHTLALAGTTLVLAALSIPMPQRVGALLELAVAVMLVVLGARAVLRVMGVDWGKAWGHGAHKPDDELAHGTAAAASKRTVRWPANTRPLLVGMVHGLAGSGALTAFMLATLPSTETRAAFLALFGFGSVLGMSAMSAGLGLPLGPLAREPERARWILAGAGVTAVACGVWWGYPLVLELRSI